MKLETVYACFSLEFQLKLDEYLLSVKLVLIFDKLYNKHRNSDLSLSREPLFEIQHILENQIDENR